MNIYSKEKNVEIFVKTHEAANLSNNKGNKSGANVAVEVASKLLVLSVSLVLGHFGWDSIFRNSAIRGGSSFYNS